MSQTRNISNDGRSFQNLVLKIAGAYDNLKVMKLEKADAPTKFFGNKIIPQENPFPDFIGCWHQHGRMIALEAKSTSGHLLPIDVKGGGLTTKQCNLLRDWRIAGAISAVLWEYKNNGVLFIPSDCVEREVALGKRSLRFEDYVVECSVVPGLGYVMWDFALNIESLLNR